MSILELSMQGSVMIAAILLIRALALYRLPRQTFVILWLIAALRLVLPWALPSVLSIYAAVPGPRMPATVGMPVARTVVLQDAGAAGKGTLPAGGAESGSIWLWIWLAGALVTGTVFIVLYVRWIRRFAASLPANSAEIAAWMSEHPLRRRLQIRQSDWIMTPLTYGIMRPVILLPRSADRLDKETLDWILMHEYVHIRRLDSLTKLILMAAVSLHWFNPLVWLMYILADRDIELSCDEGVLNRRGNSGSYARMLLRMAEQRSVQMPFASSFSRSTLEERIRSIMKHKRHTVLVVVLAAVLVIGISTALATTPPNAADDAAVSRTYSDLTPAELEAMDEASDVEWWTAEEYEAWLASEKVALQNALGTKAWTNVDGEFVWTQEKIDETIAMYEQVLAQIRSGLLVSKSVDGSGDAILAEGPDMTPEDYAPYGLDADADGTLRYEGEKVRFFTDRVELEPGMSASKCNYLNDEGTVSVRTVREATPNGDGSVDPFGRLVGLERLSSAEAEALIQEYLVSAQQETTVVAEDLAVQEAISEEREISAEVLKPYAAFGLQWQMGPGGLSMSRQGKPVHSLYDEKEALWVANNMHGYDLAGSVDLEAVYDGSRLTGLREHECTHRQEATTVVMETDVQEQSGQTFESIFARYALLGLTFSTDRTDGTARYNLFYQGRPVNHFVDEDDNHVFTFDSSDQTPGGLRAEVVYRDGKAVRIEAK